LIQSNTQNAFGISSSEYLQKTLEGYRLIRIVISQPVAIYVLG